MSDIAVWLERLGLAKYTAVFGDNDVDLDVLLRLSDDDLRELGLPLGARKKILHAVAELRERSAPAQASASADLDATAAAAERRQITVLFADVVDSTALSGRVDVEDLRALVLAYQGACTAAVEEHGGYVAQYLGDGVLAYFGYPRAQEDDAVRAVRAALAVLDRMPRVNERLSAAHGVRLAVRVGLHTGLVVAGEVGAGQAREALAIGETPNIAARVQSMAAPGAVAISDSTWRLVEGYFTVEPLGPQALKGVSRPVTVYRVIGPTRVRNPFDARAARFLTPLVGRDVELALLGKRWEQALDGEGQAVWIQGDPGLGKSRLVHAFRDGITATSHETVVLNGSAHHQATAFYPVIDWLGRTLRYEPGEDDRAKHERLAARLDARGLAPDRFMAPLAALLGGGTGDGDSSASVDPAQRRRDTLDAVRRLVLAMAHERPLLLVIEDAHWIDASTQEVIGHVLDAIQTRRVLALVTARPEYQAPWAGLVHVSAVTLRRLSRRDTDAMIRRVAANDLTPELLAELVAKTDGIPLYVEELTRSALDVGPGVPAVPATLQDALTARLDRLAPVRELIQVAALLGRVFDADIVQAVMGLDRAQLKRALSDLIGAGIVYRRSDQERHTFEFKHALIQDAALNTLVRERRALLSGRIAHVMKAAFPALVDIEPETYARHLTEAGAWMEAIQAWRIAAQRAVVGSAATEAAALYRRAIALVPRLESAEERALTEFELQLGLASALIAVAGTGGAEQVGMAFKRAHELCGSVGDVEKRFHNLIGLWRFHVFRNELDRAVPIVRDAARLSKSITDDGIASVEAEMALGITDLWLGALPDAIRRLEAALRGYDFERHGRHIVQFGRDAGPSCSAYLCWAYAAAGHSDRARRQLETSVDLAARRNHAYTTATVHMVATGTSWVLRDVAAVRAFGSRLHAMCVEHGIRPGIAIATVFVEWARSQEDPATCAITEMTRGIEMWRAAGNELVRPEFETAHAEALLRVGRGAEAAALLDDLLHRATETTARVSIPESLRLRGSIARLRGDHDAAATYYRNAVELADRQRARLFQLRAATEWGRLLVEQGARVQARALVEPIHASFTEGFDTPDVTDAKALLGELA